jgi:DNA (cytosine-5)-methyltransferase 1
MVQTVDAEADRSGREDAPAIGEKLRLLDLFSGIGGFSLGLERSGGFETVAFCEISAPCRHLLAHHWSDVPCHEDVEALRGETLGRIDAICGGFPCQDISLAGKGAGLAGERSGLWREYARLIGELRPRFVIVENVSALLVRGMGAVLCDLAALGYDCWWDCIPASAVGAPHRRDRLWIVAYARGQQHEGFGDALRREIAKGLYEAALGDAYDQRELQPQGRVSDERGWLGHPGWWLSEPDVGRVADGISARVDRLHGLGNAVVPQIPELIGRAILEALLSDGAPTRQDETAVPSNPLRALAPLINGSAFPAAATPPQ